MNSKDLNKKYLVLILLAIVFIGILIYYRYLQLEYSDKNWYLYQGTMNINDDGNEVKITGSSERWIDDLDNDIGNQYHKPISDEGLPINYLISWHERNKEQQGQIYLGVVDDEGNIIAMAGYEDGAPDEYGKLKAWIHNPAHEQADWIWSGESDKYGVASFSIKKENSDNISIYYNENVVLNQYNEEFISHIAVISSSKDGAVFPVSEIYIEEGTNRYDCYDFSWEINFEDDWYSYSPDRETYVDPSGTYNQDKLKKIRQKVENVNRKQCLDYIIDRVVIENNMSDEEVIMSLWNFIARAMYHNPLEQPLEVDNATIITDAIELLNLHEGRCGHVAHVSQALLIAAGYQSRIEYLGRHILAEVYYQGSWHIFDPDMFKNGIIPNINEDIPSVKQIKLNPTVLDQFPMTGWWVRSGTHYAQNTQGDDITGYVSVNYTNDYVGYPSSFYVKEIEYAPQIVTPIKSKVNEKNNEVFLQWSETFDKDNDFLYYEVSIGSTSKEWSYNNLTYNDLGINGEFPRETGIEIGSYQTIEEKINITIEEPGKYYWSVKAVDNHIKKAPQSYYWSSDEGEFTIN